MKALQRELREFEESMRGRHKRIRKWSEKQAHIEFLRAMYNYRRVSNLFLDVANLKYAMHLKNFGSDFDRALQRIKVCVHEE